MLRDKWYHSYHILFIAGLISSASFAPLFFWPVLLLSFSCLLFCLSKAISLKTAFLQGWWFGFGHFTSGLYWVCISLFTDFEKFWWLLPFALFGLPAILAIYIGLVTAFTYLVPARAWCKYILFAALWVIFEYLRARLFSGFPWNLIGYVWTGSDETMQLASVVGVYGLSFFTILISSCLYPYFTSSSKRNIIYGLSLSSVLVIFLYGFGYDRLQHANHETTNIKLRIVQANIAQNQKWDNHLLYANLMEYVNLSKADSGVIDYVIWPESAVPFLINHHDVRKVLTAAVPVGGLLFTGSIRADEGPKPRKHWNSTSIINGQGAIVNSYAKAHLLPFGEYIPFRSFLPQTIRKLSYGDTDFSEGVDNVVLILNHKLPVVAPLICYEAIFDGRLHNEMQVLQDGEVVGTARPEWILNTTNDAWFGNSSGPYQHFNMIRLRSVEFGIPLVRSANTGISAIVDAYGRVRESLKLGEKGVIDGFLPKSIITPSFYSRYGEWTILAIMFFALLIAYYFEKQ